MFGLFRLDETGYKFKVTIKSQNIHKIAFMHQHLFMHSIFMRVVFTWKQLFCIKCVYAYVSMHKQTLFVMRKQIFMPLQRRWRGTPFPPPSSG